MEVAHPVKLGDVADALEMVSDDILVHLDLETGEIVAIQREFLSAAEEQDEPDEDAPQWQQEAYAEAVRVYENPERYPSKYDIHD